MNLKSIIVFLFVVVFSNSFSQCPRPILWEMNRLDVNTALVWSSGGIDEHPMWSEDGNFIIFNDMGVWRKIDLRELWFTPSTWLRKDIGQNDTEILDSVTAQELMSAQLNTVYDPRKITTTSGITLELRQEGFTTKFIRKSGSGPEKVLWQTGGDNCHSIGVSNDEKFIAFISEENGIMVYCINEVDYKKGLPETVTLMNDVLNTMRPNGFDKTEKKLDKITKIDSTFSEAYFWKAFIASYKENNDLAIELLNKAIAINPEVSSYYYMLYQLHNSMGKSDLAVEALHQYNRIKPFDSHGYYDLGMLYKKLGDKELACDNMQLARKMRSKRALKEIPLVCE